MMVDGLVSTIFCDDFLEAIICGASSKRESRRSRIIRPAFVVWMRARLHAVGGRRAIL
jgi:hypothetical protein